MSGNPQRTSIVLSTVLALIIFGLEIATPQGGPESTLYVLVVLAGLTSKERRIVLWTLILSTILTIIGFAISPDSLDPWTSITARLFSILAFWILGLVGLEHIWTRLNLLTLNKELEQRIAENDSKTS